MGSSLSLLVAIAYFTVALTPDIFEVHFTGSDGVFPPRKKERQPRPFHGIAGDAVVALRIGSALQTL
jgi:hypothetical protein